MKSQLRFAVTANLIHFLWIALGQLTGRTFGHMLRRMLQEDIAIKRVLSARMSWLHAPLICVSAMFSVAGRGVQQMHEFSMMLVSETLQFLWENFTLRMRVFR
jgi:hypothetical protein